MEATAHFHFTDWSGFSLLLQDACENIIGIETYKKKIKSIVMKITDNIE